MFDPAQNPNAPGAPRALGNEAAIAAPVQNARQRAAGRRARRPRRRALRSISSTLAGNAPAQPASARWRQCRRRWHRSQLPPPPARNTSATGEQLATLPPSATPQDEYDMAYGYVLHKDYALAEQAFRDFLRKYPNERLVPDAQYWLGESLFQRQRYRDAAESFLAVSTKYRALRQGAGCAAAARPVARRAQSEGSGLRHAGRSRAQISARLGEREARRHAGTKACALLRLRPVSAAEAKALFSDLDHLPALVLAVSGGPDSTALMVLAARWRKALKSKAEADRGHRRSRPAHGSQARSGRRSGDWRASSGIAHRTLRWTGTKPKTGLQQAARHGALPPARRRGAQSRRRAHPHRAYARRPGRDRADPHEPRQRPHRAGGDDADHRRCRATARADQAGPPAARYSEGAARRHLARRENCVRRRSVQPRSALHAGAAARPDAGARARRPRCPPAFAAGAAAQAADMAIEAAVDRADGRIGGLDIGAGRRSRSTRRALPPCPPRSRCGCSAARWPAPAMKGRSNWPSWRR